MTQASFKTAECRTCHPIKQHEPHSHGHHKLIFTRWFLLGIDRFRYRLARRPWRQPQCSNGFGQRETGLIIRDLRACFVRTFIPKTILETVLRKEGWVTLRKLPFIITHTSFTHFSSLQLCHDNNRSCKSPMGIVGNERVHTVWHWMPVCSGAAGTPPD